MSMMKVKHQGRRQNAENNDDEHSIQRCCSNLPTYKKYDNNHNLEEGELFEAITDKILVIYYLFFTQKKEDAENFFVGGKFVS